jgi:hypothetical protein
MRLHLYRPGGDFRRICQRRSEMDDPWLRCGRREPPDAGRLGPGVVAEQESHHARVVLGARDRAFRRQNRSACKTDRTDGERNEQRAKRRDTER